MEIEKDLLTTMYPHQMINKSSLTAGVRNSKNENIGHTGYIRRKLTNLLHLSCQSHSLFLLQQTLLKWHVGVHLLH